MVGRFRFRSPALVLLIVLLVAALCGPAAAKGFTQLNLDSNIPDLALHEDPLVVNAWGTAFNAAGTILWVNENGTGVSRLFDRFGVPLSFVTIPPPDDQPGPATPTGIVFNPTEDFVVSDDDVSRPSLFLFDTEDGTISGWNPQVDAANAILMVDRSPSGAVYKGLAMAQSDGDNFLFATNFHSGFVEKFDADFNLVDEFTAADIPDDFAPFGIRNINGNLFVTYAKQLLPDKHDDEAGPGNGFIVVFDPDGNVVSLFAEHGLLNSPWGLLVAPDGFGQVSEALLVGNFGDGHINVFDLDSGMFMGQLEGRDGEPLVIDGLWGLEKNPVFTDSVRFIYFSAGPNDESDGLIGTLRLAPAFGLIRRTFGASFSHRSWLRDRTLSRDRSMLRSLGRVR